MSQADFPQDDPPASTGGERHSRERIVRTTTGDRIRRLTLRFARKLAGSPRSRFDHLRRTLPALLLVVVPVYWVVDAVHRATLTTIGRDQGIFQYIAWAVRTGSIDYRDVRDVNGPLIHLIHLVGLALGGADEQRFHVLDLVATGASFAIVGALLPGIVSTRKPKWTERLAWGLATWVVLTAQYSLYLYWNQAQRESFADWFLLPSIALQAARPNPRTAFRRVVIVAALSTLTWFGKSSFVVFTVMQFAMLLFDRESGLSRGARVKAFIFGGLLGGVVPLLYLLRYGDVVAYLQVTVRDVPQVYRFIWARSTREILGDEGPLTDATFGLTVTVVIVALVAMRTLPRRTLVLAFAPICGIASAVLQHKGFDYHFHPLTASTHIGVVALIVAFWELYRGAPRTRRLGRLVALGAAAGYALFVASAMKRSPHTHNVWILGGGETPEKRMEREYFDTFKSHDFFPWELRQGARYLSDVTSEDARVQVYGMDPYLLFLARRRSATPYIYAYDLNADAALDGGWGNEPTWIESERIKAWRRGHEEDMLARLKAAPPEAFVFIDRAPLITWPDAWEDFKHCCKNSALWVAQHYHAARSFGEVHVWLRDDMPIKDAEGLP
jgi:hypothetical protein